MSQHAIGELDSRGRRSGADRSASVPGGLDALRMTASGSLGIVVWFTLFGLGLFINSAAYRDKLGAGVEAHSFVMSILTYTPTNIGLICLAAAFVGGCTSRLQMGRRPLPLEPEASAPGAAKEPEASGGAAESAPPFSESDLFRTENPASSMLRGFVVYGAYMAGSFIATDKPFSATSPELYARAAGAVSLAAFTMGFDPTFLYTMIGLKGRGGGAKQ